MTRLYPVRVDPRSGQRLCLFLLACCWLIAFGVAKGADAEDAAALEKQVADLRQQGKYREAIPAARSSVALMEKTHGAEAWQTALRLNDLGSLCREIGDYAQAEPLLL